MRIKVLLTITMLVYQMVSAQALTTIEDEPASIKKIDSTEFYSIINKARFFERKNKDSAYFYAEKALKLAEDSKEARFLASAYYCNAVVLEFDNKLKEAVTYYNKAIPIYLQLGKKASVANIYNYIGYCYENLNAEDKALGYYLKSLNLFKEINDQPGIASNLSSVGNLYYEENNFELAEDYFSEALTIFTSVKDTFGIANSYINLGNLYSEQGDLNKGISYYHKSIDLSRKQNDDNGIAINFNNLGDSYITLKEYDKAEFYFESALKTAVKVGDVDLETILYLNLADLKNKTGNHKKAIDFAVKGLELAKKINNIDYEVDFYKEFAIANEGLKQDKTAITYYKLHNKLRDSIIDLDKFKKVQLFKSLNELQEQQFQINRLAAENELKDLKYESERKFVMGLIALVVIFGVMLILLINNQTSKKKAYNLLAFKNYQIHKMKDEIQDQRDDLNQLNLTKDRFFSIIAHDLKNPFNSIKGFTELLIENDSTYDSEKRTKFLKIIKGATNKASNLLSNLLIWANTQSGSISYSPTKLNLKDVVASVFSLLEIQAINKEIEMVNTVDNTIYVNADENMLNTILRNLLSNAVKFTHNNGKIIVNAFELENKVQVEVIDNGVGISEEDKNSLFKIDVKNSNVGTANEQGSGLGLILCKEFVDKHKGEIWVESEKNKGSKFIFTLPTT